jgi:peptidoglycan/xylan/chitin deacetylase (PgdA/CDA1 family)
MMMNFVYRARIWFIILFVLFCALFLKQANCLTSVRGLLAGDFQDEIKWHGITQQPVVALTFDDGPDLIYTAEILAILKHYHIPATFFVEGKNAAAHPELLRAELATGSEIGNHTFSHPHLQRMNLIHVERQISRTDEIIQRITGQKPLLFRPPYEELDQQILNASRNLRKTTVMSTISLEHHVIKEPRRMALIVVRNIRPGGIILAHDGRLDRSLTVIALPILIEELKHKGYHFVTVSELLSLR